jgi:hypothetical protein
LVETCGGERYLSEASRGIGGGCAVSADECHRRCPFDDEDELPGES